MELLDTLLLVGGADSDRPYLRELFQDEYNLLEADSLQQGLFLLEQNRDCIAAAIIDRPPPKGKKDSFLRAAQARGLTRDIPILALIAPTGSGRLEELAFSLGAADVVPKPYLPAVIRHRVQTMVELYRSRQNLMQTLEEQAEAIRHTNEIMVDALSAIIEYRSAESGSHILRIRGFTRILLEEVARSCPEYGLTPEDITNIASAAALHDIGKISIPDHILNKPDKLTDEEMEVMKTHTTNGVHMIEALTGATSEEYLRYAYNICRHHHERWNGAGYPDGLAGDNIPICAQVVGMADVFDALTSDRVYKKAYPPAIAVNMILNGDCGRFSPKLLTCFKRVVPAFIGLAEQYAGGLSPKAEDFSLPKPAAVPADRELTSLQTTQLKYETLLHFTGATVVEMDLDRGTFHVVYNPLPNFQPIPNISPLEQALETAATTNIHPDDVELTRQEYRFLLDGFFSQGLRRHSFIHRIWSPVLRDHRRYQVTFLRLDAGSATQRKCILVWQPASALPLMEEARTEEVKAMYLMMGFVIRRYNDRWFTLPDNGRNLIDLLGYSAQDLHDQFHDHFLELVLPEDRDPLRDQVAQALRSGARVETEYRVRHKDGRVLWILEKGFVVSDIGGQEYFYGILIDNTASHTVQAELEEALRFNQLILEHTNNIIFSWDLSNDHVEVSPNWKNTLGYDPTIVLHSDMLSLSRIHPDDMEAVGAMGRALRAGGSCQEAELRIADQSNHYLWFRMRLTPMLDDRGQTYRALGTLTNIDNIKRSYLVLREQAQRDPLTGLLNKASTQNAIRDYLDGGSEGCALLMIDLDNFKAVNDRFGHLFGDTVLSRVAQTIRRLFRGGDIIGRVGGDEFMVLMKDTRDTQLVRDRCQLLISELKILFQEDGEEESEAEKDRLRKVSCSIGVSLAPDHGSAFQELFHRADQALYHAKQQGKSCYALFDPSLDLAIPIQQDATPIDSNDQPELAYNNLVRAVFHRLANARDVERSIQEVVDLVGQRTNVSRVYIFENNDENTHCSNTFEWCNEGITPEIDNLQDLSYETDIPGWEDNYDENGILFCTDITQMSPSARAVLEPQGIKSMLHRAIYENGVFRGYLGLDECTANRIWTQEQVDILVFLAEVVTSFLLKKRTQDKLTAMGANLHSVLDNQHNWMYVVDPADFRLLYINEKTRQTVPGIRLGDVCHRVIMGRDTPCKDCPMAQLDRDGFAKSRLTSRALDAPVVAEASRVQWDGKDACLITCRTPD